MVNATVIIIGSGLSGLTAAHRLLSLLPSLPSTSCVTVKVLEADGRAGGRLVSGERGGDLGAAWTWENDGNLRSLAEGLSVRVVPQQWRGKVATTGERDREAREGEVACGEGGSRFVGGASAVVDRLVTALSLSSVSLSLSSPVTAITYSSTTSKVGVTVTTPATVTTPSSSTVLSADCVIVAAPPHAIASSITFTPPLPPAVLSSMSRTQTWMHGTGKAVVTYDRPFWREEGYSGTAMGGDVFDVTWDNSYGEDGEGDGAVYAIAGFLKNGDGNGGGVEVTARGGGTLTGREDEQKNALEARVLESLVRWFGPEAGGGTVSTKTWTGSSLHGHGEHDRTASSHNYGLHKRHPGTDGRVVFAGTESEDENGHMEGAVKAGVRAAEEVGRVLGGLGGGK